MKNTSPTLSDALDKLESGDIDAAHRIVQNFEGDAVADSIHAIIHRRNGDLSNSAYWWRRVGSELPAELSRLYGGDPVGFSHTLKRSSTAPAGGDEALHRQEVAALRRAVEERRL